MEDLSRRIANLSPEKRALLEQRFMKAGAELPIQTETSAVHRCFR